MENTNTVQFKDDEATFFLASGDSYVGPFRPSEVYKKLQDKEITWIDFCYREKEGAWVRLYDHPVFKTFQAVAPTPKPKTQAPPPPPQAVLETKWFLFQKDTQTGPYGAQELLRLTQAGQVDANAFVWQEAFTEWKPITDIPELKVTSSPAKSETVAQSKPSDRRSAPRKPLVAQIYLTNQKQIITGLCRDISVGGMQILTDEIPGTLGEQIQLNVLPPESSGLKPFVAEGVIVRILEDQRGFSFRFMNIKDEAKKSIESYIA